MRQSDRSTGSSRQRESIVGGFSEGRRIIHSCPPVISPSVCPHRNSLHQHSVGRNTEQWLSLWAHRWISRVKGKNDSTEAGFAIKSYRSFFLVLSLLVIFQVLYQCREGSIQQWSFVSWDLPPIIPLKGALWDSSCPFCFHWNLDSLRQFGGFVNLRPTKVDHVSTDKLNTCGIKYVTCKVDHLPFYPYALRDIMKKRCCFWLAGSFWDLHVTQAC